MIGDGDEQVMELRRPSHCVYSKPQRSFWVFFFCFFSDSLLYIAFKVEENSQMIVSADEQKSPVT